MLKKYIKLQIIISTVFQIFTSAIIPPVLLALIAKYLVSRFGIGEWIMAVAVLLGVAIGIFSMITTVIRASHLLGNTEDPEKTDKDNKKGTGSNGI